jgi:hypothetical protein
MKPALKVSMGWADVLAKDFSPQLRFPHRARATGKLLRAAYRIVFLNVSKAGVVDQCGRYRFGFLFWNPVFDELRRTTLPAGSHGGIPGSFSKGRIGLCLFGSNAFVGESRGLAHLTNTIKFSRLRKRLPLGAASYPRRRHRKQGGRPIFSLDLRLHFLSYRQ